jgi:hypothetical protein
MAEDAELKRVNEDSESENRLEMISAAAEVETAASELRSSSSGMV